VFINKQFVGCVKGSRGEEEQHRDRKEENMQTLQQ